MAKAPAFQFYPQDWLVGTATLTPAQKGGYIDLLAYEWEHGAIAKDMAGKFSGLSGKDLEIVLRKFSLIDDFYKNERLEKTRARQDAFFKKQSNNGKLGGRPKAKHNPNESQTITQNKARVGEPFLEEEDEEEVKDKGYLEKTEKPFEDSDDEKLKQYDEWALLIREGRDPFFESELYNSKIDVVEVTSDRIGLFIGLLNTYPKKRPSSQQAFRKSLLAFIIEQKGKKANGNSKFSPPPTDTVYKKPEKISEPLQDLTKVDPLKTQSDWGAMIQADIEKTLAGKVFLPRVGAIKIDWLVKQKKHSVTAEKIAEYKIIAQDEFIQRLMNNMEEISNRVQLDYFKETGTWKDTEVAKIGVIAKELAYRDYLNSQLPQYQEPEETFEPNVEEKSTS